MLQKNKLNNTPYKLAASLICADMLNLEAVLIELQNAKIDHIHFDVMDGNFVPRLGLHPEMLVAVKSKTHIPVDVHLMIDNPEKYIQLFADAGGDYIVVHVESTRHLDYCIRMIKKLGKKAGVALNPSTPLNVIDHILDDVDLIELMAINPGIVGHKLIPRVFDKIAELKEKLANYPGIIIEIDGGVTCDSAPEMVKRGATMLVCGTGSIFREPGLEENIQSMRTLIDETIKNW